MSPLEDGFGHWLAGFIDGEGCFIVYGGGSRGPRMKCRLAICVRADELPTLQEIQRRVGAGKIVMRDRPPANPQAVWQVQSREDCLRVVEILDVFPLRAKKRHDYALWREAVLAWNKVKRGSVSVVSLNAPHWELMEAMKDQMSRGRAYASA